MPASKHESTRARTIAKVINEAAQTKRGDPTDIRPTD